MIYNASFIPDEQKLKLQPGDLFDRIINLKLNCIDVTTKKREEFVIRSDYEMVFANSAIPLDTNSLKESVNNMVIIRRCTQKPSIKVQCKLVSSNTGIGIDVYVSNFFLLTSDGKHLRSFNNSQYRIESVEIAMGYWGQFKRADESLPMTYDDYFTIKAENGADKITMTGSIVVTTEKLPPDSMLHIKGYVADIYGSPVTVSKITTPERALSNPVASSGKGFEEICYNLITKRYLSLQHYEGLKKGKLTNRRNIAVSDIKDFPVPVTFNPETGLMSDSDADLYGVKVYLSNEAKKITIPKKKLQDGSEKEQTLYFEAGWTIGQTVSRIITFMDAELNYTFNSKGDILIYGTKEVTSPDKLYSAFKTEGMYEKTVFANPALYDNKLPAVHNINIDAVATIVCPFFTFIEPFQYIEFASRYALTSTVTYFASYAPTIYRFLVINATISFATVDDVNEVQITAVSSMNDLKN